MNEAYSLLSDPVRRERYDLYGTDGSDDEDAVGTGGGGSSRRGAPTAPSAYISIDDLISLTFGTRRRRYKLLTDEPFLVLLVQLIPILVFLAITLSKPSSTPTAYASTSPPFQMQPGGEYTLERRLDAVGVTF